VISIEPAHSLVLGDHNRLQQVFWNLFSNAVKFTPRGGRVEVSASVNESHVRVSVTDTGIGIDPDFLPFIFDRFRQADGSTTREHGGLGLGLAIVRHLLELHHGTVEVESQGPNLGSTFTVVLPTAASDAPESKVNEDTFAYASLGPQPFCANERLNGLRVLVVDDEPDARDLLSAILTRCGSDVRCSDSAADAIQTFSEWHPDVLISDIGLPNEDGYSLIRRVRQLDSKRAKLIPAVALTAYATDEDRSQALAAGFQIHVAKPIEPENFVISIASIVNPDNNRNQS
jgi:CheY-like chemotaxis protein/anti-sigma regulatory factor (Ser/Thr protein kinase)